MPKPKPEPSSSGATASDVKQLHSDIKHLLERRDRALQMYDSKYFQQLQEDFWKLSIAKPASKLFGPMRKLYDVLKGEAAQLRALQLDIASFGAMKTGKSSLSNRLAGANGSAIFVTSASPCTSYVTALRSSPGPQGGPRRFIARFYASVKQLSDIGWILKRQLKKAHDASGVPEGVQKFCDEVVTPFYEDLFIASQETIDPITQHKWRTVELTPTQWETMSTKFSEDWIRLSPIINHVASDGPVWGINLPGFSLSDCPGSTEVSLLTTMAHTAMYAATVVIYVLAVGAGASVEKDDNRRANDLTVLRELISKGSNVLFVVNKDIHPGTKEDYKRVESMIRSKIDKNAEIHTFNVLEDGVSLNALSASISQKLKRTVNHRIANFLRIFQELISVQQKLTAVVVEKHMNYHSTKLPDGKQFALPSRIPVKLPATLDEALSAARRKASSMVTRLKSKWESDVKAYIESFIATMKLNDLDLSVTFNSQELAPYQNEVYAVLLTQVQPQLECLMHQFIMSQSWKLLVELQNLTSDIAATLAQKSMENETPQLKALRHSLTLLDSGPNMTSSTLDPATITMAASASGAAIAAAALGVVAATVVTGGLVIVFGTVAAIAAGFKAAHWFTNPSEQTVRDYTFSTFKDSVTRQVSDNWKSVSKIFESLVTETFSSLEVRKLNLNMISEFTEILPRVEMLRCLHFRQELDGVAQTLERHVKLLPPPNERLACFQITPGTPNVHECVVCTRLLDTCPHLCRACNVLIPKKDCPRCMEECSSSTNLPADVRRAITSCFDFDIPDWTMVKARLADPNTQAPEGLKRMIPKLLQPHKPAIEEFSKWLLLRYGAGLTDAQPSKDTAFEALTAFQLFSLKFMIGLESDPSFPSTPDVLSRAQLHMNKELSDLGTGQIISKLMLASHANEDDSFARSTNFTDKQIGSFLDRPDKWDLTELDGAVEDLRQLDHLHGPYQKFVCFSEAWCRMENACRKTEFGADETWTAWSYLLLKLRSKHLVSDFHMAASCFSDSERRNSVLLTLMEALITDNALGQVAQDVFKAPPQPL